MGALGRLILRLLRAAPLLAALVAAAWALSTNPLAAPYVERSTEDLALTLERMVRRQATAAWIEADLAEAVATGDADRAAMLIDLARELGRPVDTSAAEAMLAARTGMMAAAHDCGACMIDVASCPTLTQLAACAMPFELSPLGDLNALRRAGFAWAAGAEVDAIDAGLAVAGLAATGALVITGGSSASVKAGTGLLRMARRMGSVTPGLARALRLPIHWDRVGPWLRGSASLEEVTDTVRLAAIGAIAADMGRVRDATSMAEALRLARLVDGPEDAARLARVAEAAGPRTTRSLHVLGKTRAFRATIRLSRAALGALAALWLVLAQLAAVLGARIGGALLRAMASQSSPAGPPRRTPSLGAAGPRPVR